MEQPGSSPDCDLLVFVYGSLRRGQANHHQLQGASHQGDARLSGLALYDLGPFPMAVASTGPSQPLQGELYRVEPELLAALDRFEGVPRLYQRRAWPLNDDQRVWVYVGRQQQVRHGLLIASGCWQGPRPDFRRPPASGRPRPAPGPAVTH